jgi:hypothetical protein
VQTFAFLLRPEDAWQKSKGKPVAPLIYKTVFYSLKRPGRRMRKGAQKSGQQSRTVQKSGTTTEESKEK